MLETGAMSDSWYLGERTEEWKWGSRERFPGSRRLFQVLRGPAHLALRPPARVVVTAVPPWEEAGSPVGWQPAVWVDGLPGLKQHRQPQ